MPDADSVEDLVSYELALRSRGVKTPRLSLVKQGATLGTVECAIDGWGIFYLDVTYTVDGRLVLIEANGSNAAFSSLVGGDHPRVAHMVASLCARQPTPADGVVAIFAHAEHFQFPAEYYRRVRLTGTGLREIGWQVRQVPAGDEASATGLTIVSGDISTLVGENAWQAGHATLKCDHGRLMYDGRRVVFVQNPNVLPALVRSGRLTRLGSSYDVDLTVFHDGPAAWIAHDKGLQQDLAARTTLTPLRYATAANREAAVAEIMRMHAEGMDVIAKMNGGSGARGVEGFQRSMHEAEVREAVEHLVASAREGYGDDVDASMWPVRLFEFAQAEPFLVNGQPRLWDGRIQCLISPGRIEVAAVVVRLCPEPFQPDTFERDAYVSNVTGRPPTIENLRDAQTVFSQIGNPDELADAIVSGVAGWSQNAFAYAATNANA